MAVALAGARMLAGVIWLANLEWKVPPQFFSDDGQSLTKVLQTASRHGVEPFRALAADVLAPHLTTTGWIVFSCELLAGALLLIGWHTSIGAALGTIQALVITAFMAPAPGEHLWAYALLVAVNLLPLVAPTNMRLSVDAWLGRGC